MSNRSPRCLKFLIFLFLVVIQVMSAKEYRGAELRTQDNYLYGRFEVRMKSAAGSGIVSSLFTYNVNGNLPADWNEIDIEFLGRYNDQVDFNIITQGEVSHSIQQPLEYNPADAFHTYAFEWTPTYVAWSVDGFEVYRELASHVSLLTHPQRMMMNIWPPIWVDWAGQLNSDILPVHAYYDWARYYSYTPGENGNFTLEWEDPFDIFNSGRWIRMSHTWDGNLSDFTTANAVFHEGYLILCLTDSVNTGYSGDPVIDEDVDPPYLVWARHYDDHVITLFSEAVDEASAEAPANYALPPNQINEATLQADGRTVRLQTNALDPDVSYNLVASGILDLADPPNGMGVQAILTRKPLRLPAAFDIAGPGRLGFISEQEWTYNDEYGYTSGNFIEHPDTTSFENTIEDSVYLTEMRDILFYDVRLPEGQYDLTLMMAETQFSSPGSRFFNVYAEDQLVLESFNIYVEAGLQKFTAVETVLEGITISDGILNLYFEALLGAPVLSGLKISRTPTSVQAGEVVPQTFSWAIYPNPFNPSTTVDYRLPDASDVSLRVYNILGQQVAVHRLGRQLSGVHRYLLSGQGLSAGIYFVTFESDGRWLATRKVAYVR